MRAAFPPPREASASRRNIRAIGFADAVDRCGLARTVIHAGQGVVLGIAVLGRVAGR